MLACSMGSYQAYIGVTCAVLLFFLIKMILENTDLKEIGLFAGESVCSVLWGGIAYKILTTVILGIYDVSLSSYKGANEISFGNIIKSIPATIPHAYRDFYDFYLAQSIQNNIFGNKKINICIFIVICTFVFYMLYVQFRHNMQRALLLIVAFAVVPVACNVIRLIAVQTKMILLMSGAMVIFPILFLCLIHRFGRETILYKTYILFMCVSLWLNICIVNNDQLAMREGRIATTTMTQNILGRLNDQEDLRKSVAFVGRPSENEFFEKTDAWNMANTYAKFGQWSCKPDCNRHSWNGMISEYCGDAREFCDDETYEDILASGEIEEMSVFPEEGCIRKIEHVLVVKVSEKYSW